MNKPSPPSRIRQIPLTQNLIYSASLTSLRHPPLNKKPQSHSFVSPTKSPGRETANMPTLKKTRRLVENRPTHTREKRCATFLPISQRKKTTHAASPPPQQRVCIQRGAPWARPAERGHGSLNKRRPRERERHPAHAQPFHGCTPLSRVSVCVCHACCMYVISVNGV